ncbi:Glucosyltransferase-like protein [Perkinsus olseni]|uniref:Alpha-1,3-glucosyltransferase n=1 Tax=Perkinsus olseni TaxID=32597 RepID=A0A7J6LAK9_PEROL|nr:Glucosyltransferase-like protein [Perkinsus olseni]KAF4659646.1 Glucosyltransferase-like protein [Perkinsus olseni]
MASTLLRVAVGPHQPHSGQGQPPMYGDYEAHRHWMELTLHTPIKEWYRTTVNNDPSYWPIDYPPLTAYHSWLMGYLTDLIGMPHAVELTASRGYEDLDHKTFMRWTVLLPDVVLLGSGMVWYFYHLPRLSVKSKALCLASALVTPGFILVDHCHFQYNSIALGLLMWAINFIVQPQFNRNHLKGAFLYSLAVMYKQTFLYFAPAMFGYLLGQVILQSSSKKDIAKRVTALGMVVVFTVALVMLPLVLADGDFTVVGRLMERMFPFKRGLYEDHVSNVWVLLSPVLKLRRWSLASEPFARIMVKVCTACTLLSCLPSVLDCILRPPRVDKRQRFLACLFQCSLSFFLFSWQVHEKAILLPLLPAMLLVADRPLFSVSFGMLSTLSLWRLMEKDNLQVATIQLALISFIIYAYTLRSLKASGSTSQDSIFFVMVAAILFLGSTLIAASWIIPPPARYPFLYPLLINSVCALGFLITQGKLATLIAKDSLPELLMRVWSYTRSTAPHKLRPVSSFTGPGSIRCLSAAGRSCLLSTARKLSSTGVTFENTLFRHSGSGVSAGVDVGHDDCIYCYDGQVLYRVDRAASRIARIRVANGVTLRPLPLPFGPSEDFVFKVYASNGSLLVLTMGTGTVYRYSPETAEWVNQLEVEGRLSSFDVRARKDLEAGHDFVYVSDDQEIIYIVPDGTVSSTTVPGARLCRLVPDIPGTACVVCTEDSGDSILLVDLCAQKVLCRLAHVNARVSFMCLTDDWRLLLGHNCDGNHEVSILELL